MKRPATRIKELKKELHYWQMQVRMESRWVRQSKEKVRQIAALMRELQKQ